MKRKLGNRFLQRWHVIPVFTADFPDFGPEYRCSAPDFTNFGTEKAVFRPDFRKSGANTAIRYQILKNPA